MITCFRWIGPAAVASLLIASPVQVAAQEQAALIVTPPAPADGRLNDGRMHVSVAMATAFQPGGAPGGGARAADGNQFRTDWSYQNLSRDSAFVLSAGSLVEPGSIGSPLTAASGLLTFSHAAGRRTRLTAAQGWSLSPFTVLGDPAEAAGPDLADDRAGFWTTRTMHTAVGVSRVLDRRTSLELSYERLGQDGGQTPGVATNTGMMRFGHRLSRSAVLRLGAGATNAGYGYGATMRQILIDAGVDYARPLPFSRRTTFEFHSGGRILTGGRVTYRFEPSLKVNKLWSASWLTSVTYERPVQFLDGFAQPLYSDAISAGAGGRIGRRLRLDSSLSYMTGTVGAGSSASAFHARSANVRASVPVTVNWQVTAEYVDGEQVFSGGLLRPGDLAGAMPRRLLRFAFVWNSAFFH